MEAFLETGHYPENTPIIEPEAQYYERFEDFSVSEVVSPGTQKEFNKPYTIDEGWVIDRRPNRQDGLQEDPEHPGVILIADNNTDNSRILLDKVTVISNATVEVSGVVLSIDLESTSFNRTYRVLTRSQQPKKIHEQPYADTDYLLITNRGLCVCFKSDEGCLKIVPLPEEEPPIILSNPPGNVIVDEPIIKINPALLTREASAQTRMPAMKAFLKQVEHSMTNSWRFPRRYPVGQVGFLESEYFKNRIKDDLPQEYLKTPLAQVSDLSQAVVDALGERTTIAEALELNLASLAKKKGLTIEEAGRARRILLGLPCNQA